MLEFLNLVQKDIDLLTKDDWKDLIFALHSWSRKVVYRHSPNLSDCELNKISGRSRLRGHSLIWIGDVEAGKWVYEDTHEDIPANGGVERPCIKCGKLWPIDGGPDHCLGTLPGVDNACCGHGYPEDAYIRFRNGVVIKGFDVIEYTEKLKKKRPLKIINESDASLQEIAKIFHRSHSTIMHSLGLLNLKRKEY